jgi:predicted 3-demethylubiquinone-9 3-methyltransferase (glyoxalase superfamily)
MQKVTPFLTFKEKGEEAVNFYVSLFPNSKITSMSRSEVDGPFAKGALQHASFQLAGQEFLAMDGGPSFSFDQGFSLLVNCKSQEEIDRLWEALAEGGEEQMCGWVKDRYGISWQIIPPMLGSLLFDPDSEKSGRVMNAMLQMKKIDIKALQQAYEGS